MKYRALFLVVACLGFLAGNAAAEESQFKQVQVKHFANAGAGVSQEFVNYFYDSLRTRLQKGKIAGQVVDEGGTVPADAAADSVVIEGRFTDYDPGSSMFRPVSLGVEIKVYRVSDHQLVTTLMPKLISKHGNDKSVAEFTGDNCGKEIRKATKNLPALATFPPAAPMPVSAPVVVAAVPQTAAADALTNSSVVEMLAAKLPEDVIIAKIQASPTNFDVSTPALADLNQKGVSSAIIKVMLTAPKAAPMAVQPAGASGSIVQGGTAPEKHYRIAEGVNFPSRLDAQTYLALFPGELRTQLQRRHVPVEVVAEGASATDTGTGGSIVVGGMTLTGISKDTGSMMVPAVITIETNLYNRSDHTLFRTIRTTIKAIGGEHAKGTPLYNANTLATWTAQWVSDDIRKAVK